MVQRVVNEQEPLFIRQVNQILATITGPRISITEQPGQIIQMDFTWDVRNEGQQDADASLRLNLQIDSFTGDVSQLIVERDGTFVGGLQSLVDDVVGNFPRSVPAGATRSLVLSVRVPAANLVNRQDSVFRFNWWTFELTAWNQTENQLATGDARFEVRDWFRIEESPAAPGEIVVVGDPTFFVTS